jgi:MarR family transcriptional repressor of emrRAB
VAHPSDLCARTAQSPANMSRICDALVERDLITRVASLHDRRKMVLRITDSGSALVRSLLPTLFGPLREMFKDFSDLEQLQLIEQLKRLGSVAERAV